MPRASRTVVLPARDSRGCLVAPGDLVRTADGAAVVVTAVDDRHVASFGLHPTMPPIPTQELRLERPGYYTVTTVSGCLSFSPNF